jgi:glucose/arabinose dehydrogenase
MVGIEPETPATGAYRLETVISADTLGRAAANKIEFALIPGAPGQALIALQTGEICRVSLTGEFPPETWGDLSDLIVFDENEEGLLSVAFSPDFEENGYVFAYYTPPKPEDGSQWFTVLSRFKATTTGVDESSRETVIEVEEYHEVHQGGHIIFDDNGYLMLSLGDGGYSGDALEAAQELDRLLGKVIRIDVSDLPYSNPHDNPFVDEPDARDEVFAYGFRNPWRMTVDSLTGEIWLGDVGEGKEEEVDHVVAGGNYGWDCYEGNLVWEATSTPLPEDDQCTGKTFITPRASYPHSEGIAVVGGYVYRGKAMPELYGFYIYADYATGRFWAVNTEDDSEPIVLIDEGTFISSFTELPDGELLVVSYSDGIYKLSND